MVSGLKLPTSEHYKIWSCLLVLARAQPVLAHAQPVLACAELVLRPYNPVWGGRHFPLKILHKTGDIWFEMPQTEKFEILGFWGS